MIAEDYVSFETAKLLKEKGFDWECRDYYSTNGSFYSEDFSSNWNNPRSSIFQLVSALTIQMAIKWLREVQGLDIDISIEYTYKKVYYYSILKKTFIRDIDCLHSETNFKSYEQAAEAAIKYCLENLI